jgi:hypothetical protein
MTNALRYPLGEVISGGFFVSKFVQPGEMVPDITLPQLDGQPLALSSFRGKKLLVFMWASW